jgi:hypothetical protein
MVGEKSPPAFSAWPEPIPALGARAERALAATLRGGDFELAAALNGQLRKACRELEQAKVRVGGR